VPRHLPAVMRKAFNFSRKPSSKETVNPAYAHPPPEISPTEYQNVKVQVERGGSSVLTRTPSSTAQAPPEAEVAVAPAVCEASGIDDAIEIVLKRDEPNVRAGIVLDNDYPSRAIVKAVAPGSLAAKTHNALSTVMWIKPRDEVFAIDGVRVKDAKHCVQLIRQSNKLEIIVLKSRKPIPEPPAAEAPAAVDIE
jgi:hypothetical protein